MVILVQALTTLTLLILFGLGLVTRAIFGATGAYVACLPIALLTLLMLPGIRRSVHASWGDGATAMAWSFRIPALVGGCAIGLLLLVA